ncbi:MAG: DNA adenine methylase [Candidatus Saccharibacteria bacterium]|nr:DNA adenine methylase [Candidatus Saccharibacteria bacterium]
MLEYKEMKSGGKLGSNKDSTVKARPFLKWVGGKSKLVPHLVEQFPKNYKTFHEPLVGGGAMFFSVQPKRACINDSNAILMGAYEDIKKDVDSVVAGLSKLEKQYRKINTEEERKEYYLKQRARFNAIHTRTIEKTILLIYLNKTCYNGMYRENSIGGFNVPFGKQTNPTICDETNLRAVSKALQKTKINMGSYEKCLRTVRPEDFIYFDPPYHPLNETSSFTSYQAGGFSAKDQEILRDKFKELSNKGCYVMMSNSNSPLIRKLYKEFKIHEIDAARSINSKASGRGKIVELYITNY